LGELAKRFDAIVTGDEVEKGKPAPDIFLLAARRLALLPEKLLSKWVGEEAGKLKL
jgi:beta-phosphoglucomutase-like phosphatase (HAD superfamily)